MILLSSIFARPPDSAYWLLSKRHRPSRKDLKHSLSFGIVLSLPMIDFHSPIVSFERPLHGELARACAHGLHQLPLLGFAGLRSFADRLVDHGKVVAVAITPGRIRVSPLIRRLPKEILVSPTPPRGGHVAEDAISRGQSLALGLVHFILGHLRTSHSELSNSFSRTFYGHSPTLQKGTSFAHARAHKRAEAIDRHQARDWPPLLLWVSDLFAVGVSYSTSNVDERFRRSYPNYTKWRIVSTFVRRVICREFFKVGVGGINLKGKPATTLN